MTIDNQNRFFAEEISKWIYLDNKRILEVGCGDGGLLRYIAKYYSPEHIIGVDPMLDSWWKASKSSGDNWEVTSGDAEMLDFEDNTFDAVISISTFEHIGDVDKALSEIKRVLKPYGRFYTSFCPIWTSVMGHHFIASDDDTWNDEHLKLIPPWGHLYMTEDEMRSHLTGLGADEGLISQILNFVYHSNYINRKTKAELVSALNKSGMLVRMYSERIYLSRFPMTRQNELSQDITDKLIAAGYSLPDVCVFGMKTCLEKFSAC